MSSYFYNNTVGVVGAGGSIITPGPNYDPTAEVNNTNTPGIVFLWVAFGFMVFSAAAFFISALRSRTEKIRKFSVVNVIVCSIAATAYMAMAFQQGFVRKENGRQFYYARYIDWVFTTPLLLFELASLAGAGTTLTLLIIVLDVIMIITGLFGGLSVRRGPTWVWFGMGCLAVLPIFYLVAVHYRKFLNDHTKRAYTVQSFWLISLWLVYPIAWGLTDGGYIISVDYEHLWFAILDVLAKCVFGAFTVFVFRLPCPTLRVTSPTPSPTPPITLRSSTTIVRSPRSLCQPLPTEAARWEESRTPPRPPELPARLQPRPSLRLFESMVHCPNTI